MVCLYDVQTQPATVPVSMTYLGSPVTSSWIPTPTATIKKVRWPIRPIWTGLLVDTLVLAVIAYLAWIVMVIPRRFIREVRWVKNGCCVKCGYDLGYNLQAGCPECGWRR